MTLAPFTYRMPYGLSRPCLAVLTGDDTGCGSAARLPCKPPACPCKRIRSTTARPSDRPSPPVLGLDSGPPVLGLDSGPPLDAYQRLLRGLALCRPLWRRYPDGRRLHLGFRALRRPDAQRRPGLAGAPRAGVTGGERDPQHGLVKLPGPARVPGHHRHVRDVALAQPGGPRRPPEQHPAVPERVNDHRAAAVGLPAGSRRRAAERVSSPDAGSGRTGGCITPSSSSGRSGLRRAEPNFWLAGRPGRVGSAGAIDLVITFTVNMRCCLQPVVLGTAFSGARATDGLR
jgi:hypothetical protein